MSEISNREKEIFLGKILNECNTYINTNIDNCSKLAKYFGLGQPNLPNIAIYCYNKLISLEKEFKNFGINFFDHQNCACFIIIARNFRIMLAKSDYILKNYSKILTVSKEQVKEYVDSFKKPSFFDAIFKGAKYSPRKSILTDKQIHDSKICIKEYLSYCDQIYDFSIPDGIVESFKRYYAYSILSGKKVSDNFVSKLVSEVQKLGYASIKSTLDHEIQILNISLEFYSSIHF